MVCWTTDFARVAYNAALSCASQGLWRRDSVGDDTNPSIRPAVEV